MYLSKSIKGKKAVFFIRFVLIIAIFCSNHSPLRAQMKRFRDYNFYPGQMKPGPLNALTDVKGVKVGHCTLIVGDSIRTGVTAIIPHPGNIFQNKVPAAIYIGNGFGKLAGYSQVAELGNIETPIILTNTLNVARGIDALITYTLDQPENKAVRSVNAIVGETNDGYLNDIQGRHLQENHFLKAIEQAQSGRVEEGNVGAGTGTICFGYKGGLGTSSRVLAQKQGGYTVGVLVQANFGGSLQILGLPIPELLEKARKGPLDSKDGSCMIVVITDAPLSARNLKRLAKRALLGLGRTGGIASNGSGDYVIALSVAPDNLVPYQSSSPFYPSQTLRNEAMSPLFQACIEATEEAILNALFAAEDMKGRDGHFIPALPKEKVIELLNQYYPEND